MNKNMLAGIGIGVVAAVSIAAISGHHKGNDNENTVTTATDTTQIAPAPAPAPTFAQVVSVTPNTKTISTPRQQCKNVTVTHQAPVKDQHRVVGTALGAAAGGAIGHQIGNGKGNTVATVVGAVGGAIAGHKVQENMQANDTYNTTEQQCSTVYDKSQKTVSYSVTYQIDGKQSKTTMSYNPGNPGTQIPLDQNGQLVVKS